MNEGKCVLIYPWNCRYGIRCGQNTYHLSRVTEKSGWMRRNPGGTIGSACSGVYRYGNWGSDWGTTSRQPLMTTFCCPKLDSCHMKRAVIREASPLVSKVKHIFMSSGKQAFDQRATLSSVIFREFQSHTSKACYIIKNLFPFFFKKNSKQV